MIRFDVFCSMQPSPNSLKCSVTSKEHSFAIPLSDDDLVSVVGGGNYKKMPNPLKGAKPSPWSYAAPKPRVEYRKGIGWL
jgi:hypothetical protein